MKDALQRAKQRLSHTRVDNVDWYWPAEEDAARREPQDTVRGYRARRFLGDSSAWGNADLRLRVSRITIILPGAWGIVGFADAGRVWLEGESSDTWHAGYGGGIWLSLLNDRMCFSSGISHSKESNLFFVKGGFSY